MDRLPKPPSQVAFELSNRSINALTKAMTLTKQEICDLSEFTSSQSRSQVWEQHRVGRITASISKDVYTRANTLLAKPWVAANVIVGKIMRYTKIPLTKAMIHGMASELPAKERFSTLMNQIHGECEQAECGLIVHPRKPYVAATPDLVVSCLCHGDGVCEIKCPYKIKDEPKITPENYPHLERNASGKVSLRKSSPYYYQIQHQLGVSGRQYGYFFVNILNDYFLERIEFDEKLWSDMEAKFEFMWQNYIAPEILCNTERNLLTPPSTVCNSI